MPLYDCGDEDCDECQRAFGPDRSKAIENYKRREEAYAALARDHATVLRIAERLCTASGYQWPCNFDRYSVKVEKEAVSKWWIELAEHALDVVEAESRVRIARA